MVWWGTRNNVSTRLQLEVEAMRATFGDTFRLIVPRRGNLYWVGTVEINMTNVEVREHQIKIEYPADYPTRPPEAYVIKPHVYSPKHQFEDGQLCLFNPKDGKTYGWNPGRSTAVTVTGWAINWLYAYYTWKVTKVWPGQEERIGSRSFNRRNRR